MSSPSLASDGLKPKGPKRPLFYRCFVGKEGLGYYIAR